jgi:hypothetical protein
MRRISIVLLMLCLVWGSGSGAWAAAPVSEEAVNAARMVDGILSGLNQEDYALFSRDFDQEMKARLTEPVFKTMSKDIKGKIGIFIGKEFMGTEQQGDYHIMVYRGKCTLEEAVTIRLVLSDADDSGKVSGFWLDSTKLRQ